MKYYRTTVTYTILSEDYPIDDSETLEDIYDYTYDGDCVGSFVGDFVVEELSGKQMANALYESGSSPDFFMLNDDGVKIE